jgi:hypothetical protein
VHVPSGKGHLTSTLLKLTNREDRPDDLRGRQEVRCCGVKDDIYGDTDDVGPTYPGWTLPSTTGFVYVLGSSEAVQVDEVRRVLNFLLLVSQPHQVFI